MDLLQGLEPDVRKMGEAMLASSARDGVLLKVTQGRRTYDQQQVVWDQGRKTPGEIVTHSPPGYSWHNFGRAFDVAQVGADPYPSDEAFWEKVGDIGEMAGLTWGGRWKHPDRPHFEDHGGMTLALARQIHDTQQDKS